MTITANEPKRPAGARRKDGLAGLWGRIRHRDRGAYERWLEERDMTAITACLMRLNERQLNRLGFSHSTLGMDVEDLSQRIKAEAAIGMEVLRIVEEDTPEEAMADDDGERKKDGAQARHAIAAE